MIKKRYSFVPTDHNLRYLKNHPGLELRKRSYNVVVRLHIYKVITKSKSCRWIIRESAPYAAEQASRCAPSISLAIRWLMRFITSILRYLYRAFNLPPVIVEPRGLQRYGPHSRDLSRYHAVFSHHSAPKETSQEILEKYEWLTIDQAAAVLQCSAKKVKLMVVTSQFGPCGRLGDDLPLIDNNWSGANRQYRFHRSLFRNTNGYKLTYLELTELPIALSRTEKVNERSADHEAGFLERLEKRRAD